MTAFAKRVLDWFEQHGRHDLPWQQAATPYRVWVSEIMLQQTQVNTVIPYYSRFMERFPDVGKLAAAEIDKVMHLWTGLGYYARARNLHQAAVAVVQNYGGEFPDSVEKLESLPGIGRSTAGAIAALSMNIRAPILDGNVKRVLTRYHAIGGWPEQSAVKNRLWEIAESQTPGERVADYTQAMMDLGATVCTRTRPACGICPLAADCQARLANAVSDYPGRKPRKALPVKAVRMLVCQNEQGEVLLEKRPPSGIWGGLYSFPEQAGAGQARLGPADLQVNDLHTRELPTIRHSFTHFHLDITPVYSRCFELPGAVADSDRWLWYPLDHSRQVGLSAPVRKLLSRLPEQIDEVTS